MVRKEEVIRSNDPSLARDLMNKNKKSQTMFPKTKSKICLCGPNGELGTNQGQLALK